MPAHEGPDPRFTQLSKRIDSLEAIFAPAWVHWVDGNLEKQRALVERLDALEKLVHGEWPSKVRSKSEAELALAERCDEAEDSCRKFRACLKEARSERDKLKLEVELYKPIFGKTGVSDRRTGERRVNNQYAVSFFRRRFYSDRRQP